MHKNALFFEKKKTGKLSQRWGLWPQTPNGLRRMKAPTPELLPHHLLQ